MTGLTALNPLFLSLLPLAALPVLFHLFFRLKKQPRAFPTLMFFHRIDPKLNARRRLREWLILLLRTLLILLVLLALAHPVWFGVGKEGAVAVVLVVDNSGSMSGAGPGGVSKLKHALGAARDLVGHLRASDTAAIIPLVPDPAAALPAGLTADKTALKAALERLAETEASGSVAAALDRAVAALEGSAASRREIHLLSDLQAEKWNQAPLELRAPPRGTSVVVHRIASPRAQEANVSLAGVQVPGRAPLTGRRLPLAARLVNPGTVEGRVRLNWVDDADGRGTEEVTVPPGGEKTVSVVLGPQNPGFRWVNVWLEGDEFTADNRACTGFCCSEKRSVVFAGPAAQFGQLPLAISPGGGEGRLSGLLPVFIDETALPATLGASPSALVVVTWELLAGPGARAAALRQFVEAGGHLLVVPARGSGTFGAFPDWVSAVPGAVQGAAGGVGLAVLDKANPLFNDLRDDHGDVGLRNLRATKFCPLRSAATNTAILGLEDGRLVLAEQRLGRGWVLASGLAFDSGWSTLPLKPGFVAFAQNLALAAEAAATNVVDLVAGDPLRLGAATAEKTLRVQSLAGSPLDWKGTQLPTLPRAGIYTVQTGTETAYVAVRSAEKEGRQKFLASDALPALGKLAYAVKDLTTDDALASELRQMEKSLDLSWLLVLLAFGALAAEGWLATPAPMKAAAAGWPRPGSQSGAPAAGPAPRAEVPRSPA